MGFKNMIAALAMGACVAFAGQAGADQAAPQLSAAEIFGRDAEYSDMRMSPSGNVVAFTQRAGDKTFIVVRSLVEDKHAIYDVTGSKLRGYEFYGEDYVVATRSRTLKFPGYKGEYEVYVASAMNWDKQTWTTLLTKEESLLRPQLDFSRVLAPGAKPNTVLMLARAGASQDSATLDLYRVSLETGGAELVTRGSHATIDWIVDETETIYAREDYDERRDKHSLRARRDDKWVDLFVDETEFPETYVGPLTPDRSGLLIIDGSPDQASNAVYKLTFADGAFSSAVFDNPEADIKRIIRRHGVGIGVEYTGLQPSYEFFDEVLTKDVAAVARLFPKSAVRLVDFSEDFNKLLLLVEGNEASGMFAVFDRTIRNLDVITSERPVVEQMGNAQQFAETVTARDGLKVPVIVTLPRGIAPGSDAAANLPTVMMPHGGPEAFDSLGFDYMAQFLAHKGYAVIQPNFRGSSGFGRAHLLAGRGKWGREMQDDVTDALWHFVGSGLVDKDRVCIAGASYGGYSALAGGAFTPDLYKCVVAIAAVADLPDMLAEEKRSNGSRSPIYAYWRRVIAEGKVDMDKLSDISPSDHADAFRAPVLLIHGDDDTVVDINQSRVMRDRLKRADKPVEMITLKGEDHWLSREKTRIETLQAMGDFIDKALK